MTKIQIEIANLHETKQGYRCDRASALGNPFEMKSERDRDAVCDAFSDYLDTVLRTKAPPSYVAKAIAAKYELQIAKAWRSPSYEQVRDAIAALRAKVQQGKAVRLLCWCAPKRCHCETVRDAIQDVIEGKS